ncbi:DUF6249 domain-containing protein [Bacteroidota bacterium]
MGVALIFMTLFFSVFGIFYMFYQTRNRERISIIEKGLDPGLFKLPPAEKKKSNGRRYSPLFLFSLKFGMFLLGIGLGCGLGSIILETYEFVDNGAKVFVMLSMFFIFGGLGLVSSFFMCRNIIKKDNKEEKE